MAEIVRLLEPDKIKRNPENPRLIFRQEELEALQDSIAKQGILVPLTVFQDKDRFCLLDGERRWVSALKLGLPKVPVIVQPKPDKMQNIMMMFAIHNARKDWDPLPTALKLEELEKEYIKRNKKKPTEGELAGVASLTRGEVRRLKKLLRLPQEYRKMLLFELEKPRSQQILTVDHVLEATKAAESLRKRSIIDDQSEDELRKSILEKFRSGIINNTVAPRKLVKIAQTVQRGDVSAQVAGRAIHKLITNQNYTIEDAFTETVEQSDFEHNIEQLVERLSNRLDEHKIREYHTSDSLHAALHRLLRQIKAFLQE